MLQGVSVDGEGIVAVAPRDPAAAQRARAHWHLSASRLIVLLACVGVAAALLCAAIGLSLARQSDEVRADGQRAALRAGIAELRARLGEGDIDPRLVTTIAQSAGLPDFSFDKEPAVAGREFQPVLNAQGRIVGFITWRRDAPMTAIMQRLLPLIGIIAFGLVGFAGFSLRQLRRARAELAASEDDARHAAERDPATGLFNRGKTMALLEQAIATYSDVGFGLIALDGMAGIEESYGGHGAEEIAATVAANLRDALPAPAICGRVAEYEFAVIWPGGDPSAVLRAAVTAAARPHWIDSVVHIGAHAGYARAPRDAATHDELARRAELALHAAAKKGPGTITAFDATLDELAAEQQFIRRELPRALKAKALELHYQPIVTASSGQPVGVEALLRWTHSSRGAIAPASFVPVAEQMGLIDELGAFVLRRALRDAKRWPELYISVNLSPLQVCGRGIVDLVRETLAESGIAPSRLMLEVTEGVLIDNPEEMHARIEELRALGVRIALDDFGSGYSNLGYLQRFPFDKLKVDRSFVAALGHAPNVPAIIQAIVSLGRAIGASVVVEGVETEDQRVLLRLAGCDEMQGYLFARAAPAREIDRLVWDQQSRKTNTRNSSAAA